MNDDEAVRKLLEWEIQRMRAEHRLLMRSLFWKLPILAALAYATWRLR